MEGLEQVKDLADHADSEEVRLLIYLLYFSYAAIVALAVYTAHQYTETKKEIKELHKNCDDRLEKHVQDRNEMIELTSEALVKAAAAMEKRR